MPRLSKEVVADRERFALEAFKAGKTVDEVQTKMISGWGHKMSLPRLLELQEQSKFIQAERKEAFEKAKENVFNNHASVLQKLAQPETKPPDNAAKSLTGQVLTCDPDDPKVEFAIQKANEKRKEGKPMAIVDVD